MPGIAIPSGDLWSFDAALLEFVEGLLRLKDQRIKNNNFNGPLSGFSISTNAGGAVLDRELYGRVLLSSGSLANAAIIIDPDIFDVLNDELSFAFTHDQITPGFCDSWMLFNSIAEPTVMTTGTLDADRIIQLFVLSATDVQLIYVDNGGTIQFFNGATWQGSNTNVGFFVAKAIFRNFDDAGIMKWEILLYDADGVLQATTPAVAWTATRSPAGGKSAWLIFGSPRTNLAATDVNIYKYELWGEPDSINYSITSPVATSPWFAIDQNTLDAVTAILLQLILEGTATIKFQWALNGGAFNGSFLTPAQLLAALVGGTITDHTNSMRLMSQHNSNGADQAAMLVPQTKAEASGIAAGCDYPAEIDVRLNVDYDSGNLTGLAAIPGASDVRENVPTDDTVGNYVPAIEANHALGDSYGSLGTEFTGTKVLTPFNLPVEVILEDEEILVFEGCE